MPTPDRKFFYEMLTTASPTGSSQRLLRKIVEQYRGVADKIEPDVHGNLTLTLNPGQKRSIMLAGHSDQIGFMVKHVSPQGYVFLDTLGGADYGTVLGQRMVIHSKDGPVEGVVGRKPKHIQTPEETKQIPPPEKIWVDIGAKDEKQALEKIRVGDYVTFTLGVLELENDLISSPGLDNKSGLFACLETMRRCRERKIDVTMHVVATVQEEIGSRGATTATSHLSPDIGLAVDTIQATDDPGYDLPPAQTVPCLLGSGPTISTGPNTNPVVGRLLQTVADKAKVPWQADPSGKTAPDDASAMQIGDSGVAAASVGMPLRNMHTQAEIMSYKDILVTIDLLAEFVCAVKSDTDLRPFYLEERSTQSR